MRDAFSKTLVRLAQQDHNILLITGDHGYALFDEFRQKCPSQFINAGIAEQNMIGMASGLARTGFRPFVYGLSAFVPVRVLEQIKLDVAHDDLPVVLIGDGAGFVYSHLGTSHQSTEDIACTRPIPGLTVLSPADRFEMTACLERAYDSQSPVYLRMGKSDRGDIHQVELDFTKLSFPLNVLKSSYKALAFIATGSMVKAALEIAENRIDASVWSVPCIKPLDKLAIVDIAKQSHGIVVFEEHSIIGGLGSAVTEITSAEWPCKVLRIGVQDRFSEYCGTYEYLLTEHGLDINQMTSKISDFNFNRSDFN